MMSPAHKRPPRRFQFIDNNNVASTRVNSTQVRRHVMQEYMREKRWEARTRVDHNGESELPERRRQEKVRSQSRARQRPSRSKPSARFESPSSITAPSSRGSSQELEDLRGRSSEPVQEIAPHLHKRPAETKPARGGFRVGSAAFARLADMMPDRHSSSSITSSALAPTNRPCRYCVKTKQFPEPQSILSAARTDPFDSLPLKLSLEDQLLFDFYATVMPACSYGLEKPHAQNWYFSVFIPEAMSGAVCFENAILAHAAITRARLEGMSETRLTIEHRSRASRLLLRHYQQFPNDTSDATISATIFAAALELIDPHIERRRYGWMHWEAALQKIRDRGGPAALIQHKRLQLLINWCDYMFPGYRAYGATFYSDPQLSPNHGNDQEAETIARAEVFEQWTEFITFLKCTEHLALVQAGMQRNAITKSKQALRYSAFLPGESFYTLLASEDAPRYTEACKYEQIIARLAVLMTINLAIWEYRHSTELSEQFFHELAESVKQNGLERHQSVEALLQILLSGSGDPPLRNTERPWFVGRMLKVANRLSRPNFDRLNYVLLRFLTLGPGLKPVVADWEDDLREEILQAPLMSYHSRFMLDSP
ncbi:hypothetical protein PV05_10932 [Exophiala xenobiotica]|uniref:Uncharacterized protein n=1 Tax=Exophiala xenobiotica TaxID=348802 RepID=A0A0D2BAH7_9EURO|nr:uncharacterized protein PV05_10932 [Exophiala xenobiotica]KIW49236.1 hypothetical protein PV05_10932 [Exophiala xenobiotica]